jgi:hypothetical protein
VNNRARTTARERYLASLSPEEELVARRAAEETGIPENDPTWLLLSEVRRACQETARCTAELKITASEAAARIVRASASDVVSKAKDDALADRAAVAIATQVAKNEHVNKAIAESVRGVEQDAIRAMRALETSIRDFMRRRAAAPAASMIFAFSLGVVSSCISIWGTYHIAISYGQDLGYRAGFHDARLYDRSHP